MAVRAMYEYGGFWSLYVLRPGLGMSKTALRSSSGFRPTISSAASHCSATSFTAQYGWNGSIH